jgi:hypothetical protein
LADAGWTARTINHRAVVYTDPARQAVVRCTPPSNHVPDDQLADTTGWRAGAGVNLDEPALWLAEFSVTTPPFLVAAFCKALVNPEPVARFDCDVDERVRPYLRLT